MADRGKSVDSRRHPRRPVQGYSLVAYKTQAASAYARRKNIGEQVLDISAGGLRLRLAEPVLKGESVTIEIKEMATNDVFHARGDVRWAETKELDGKPAFFCGLQFVEIFTQIGKREKFFYGGNSILNARPAGNTQIRPAGNTQMKTKPMPAPTSPSGPPTMQQPIAAASTSDGRRAERFQVDDYVVTVFRAGLLSSVGIRKNLATEVVDLSRSGAQIVMVEKVTLGTKVSFTLHLNKFADTFESEAEVVWVKEGPTPDGVGWFTGITFTSITAEKRKLIDYMMSWFTSYQAKYKAQKQI